MKINTQVLISSQFVRTAIIVTAASLPLILAALHIVHAGLSTDPATG
ncbi:MULTISPECIES: hypothetical protein [Sulfolobaceae]|nr:MULTISPECIES: hypothetical protein [unclassified Sulfolobus]